MLHAYYGDGKGKTSAAMGLALRALGHGRRVFMIQFLKGTPSGEALMFARMADVTLLMGKPGLPFVWKMTPEQKRETRAHHMEQLSRARDAALEGKCDLLILDEILGALEAGLMEEAAVVSFLDDCPPSVEVVLTGRELPQELRARADYVTCMRCERHPYEKGVQARAGIEY